jgi:hypothetical protein
MHCLSNRNPEVIEEPGCALRARMRREGFALVTTPPIRLSPTLIRGRKNRVLTSLDSRCSWRFPELVNYGEWLQRLIQQTLPEERLQLGTLEFRFERGGLVDKEVDRIHADGGYIRSLHLLWGLSTFYRNGKIEQIVPKGQTLLMTAMDRARKLHVPCTLHRRPEANSERALIVCSFISLALNPLRRDMATASGGLACQPPGA